MKKPTITELQASLEEAREIIRGQQAQINELQRREFDRLEESPIYQRLVKDAQAAQEAAEMWRELYTKAMKEIEERNQGQQQATKGQRGRPPALDQETIEAARRMRAGGSSFREIAAALNISTSTAHRFTTVR